MAAIDYLNKLRELKRPEYTSQYGGIISDLMGKIVNRQPFSYDFNADPIFQQYKDYYTKGAKEASMNAVANASALTGGYGNSYAVTAGAQANQQALSGLNNIIPQLYNAAQKKYDSDLNALYADYDLYNNAENEAYGRYRDQLSDYNNERSYLTGMYNTELAQENYLAEQAAAQAAADQQYALQLAKLNAKGSSGSSSKKNDNNKTDPAVANAILGAANVVAGIGNNAAKGTASTPTSTAYQESALTRQALELMKNPTFTATEKAPKSGATVKYNVTPIENVTQMLQSQVDKGLISEATALKVLDNLVTYNENSKDQEVGKRSK